MAWTWAWRGRYDPASHCIVIVIIHPHLLRAIIHARLFWSSVRHGWMRSFLAAYIDIWRRRLRRGLDKV
jgi:hypothetical protein